MYVSGPHLSESWPPSYYLSFTQLSLNSLEQSSGLKLKISQSYHQLCYLKTHSKYCLRTMLLVLVQKHNQRSTHIKNLVPDHYFQRQFSSKVFARAPIFVYSINEVKGRASQRVLRLEQRAVQEMAKFVSSRWRFQGYRH